MLRILVSGGGDEVNSRILELRTFVLSLGVHEVGGWETFLYLI